MTEAILHSEVVEHCGRRATVQVALVKVERTIDNRGCPHSARWVAERRVTGGWPTTYVSPTKHDAIAKAREWIAGAEAFRAQVRAAMDDINAIQLGEQPE
jgi:hypothetical protein